MDNRMTVRMFRDVFGGLSPATQAFLAGVIALLGSDGILRISAGELGEILFPGEDRGAVVQRVNRLKRILQDELESQGLTDIMEVRSFPSTPNMMAHTEYRFDLARFVDMSAAAAAVAA